MTRWELVESRPGLWDLTEDGRAVLYDVPEDHAIAHIRAHHRDGDEILRDFYEVSVEELG